MIDEPKQCDSPCTFAVGEKLFVRTTFVLSVLLGAWGIWGSSPGAALGYMAYAVFSYFLLMRFTVCSRCPHYLVAGDCLFMPVRWVRLFVRPRHGELTWWERLVLDSAVLGTAVIPLFWLVSVPLLLILYLIVTVGCGLFLVRRICSRKCRVGICPLNKRFRAEG